MKKFTGNRYGSIAQFFHWATALLVLIAFIYGPGGPEQRVYSSGHEWGRQLHETLGLCVLAIAVMRLLWRLVDVRPTAPSASQWMRVTAAVVQSTLYVLLLALPLTAIAGAWLEGHPLMLINGIQVPPLIAPSHDVGSTVASIHAWLGDAIMWLAGFHALASLYHHFVLKDDVLMSMLPRWVLVRRSSRTG